MKIIVAGAGIAGLALALALAGEGRQIEIYDRDLAPPEGDFDHLFDEWDRRGVTHLRHSHGFLARLATLIRTRHPELMRRLIAAGVAVIPFEDMLAPDARKKYRPEPDDIDIRVLICRRSTLEGVIRAYAQEQPDVVFRTGSILRGIVCEPNAAGIPVAKAFKVETSEGVTEQVRGDVLIDASGRNSPMIDWLAEYGVKPEHESAPVPHYYFTRHYRVHPGVTPFAVDKAPGGEYALLRARIYPADSGNFSLTMMAPELEVELRTALPAPEIFEAVARTLPGFAEWIDPERVRPVTKVLGMGNLKSIWHAWDKDGAPLVLNFFAIGDAAIRSNPAYGRGCTYAFVQADILADVLSKFGDPVVRCLEYSKRCREELRPDFDMVLGMDRSFVKQVQAAMDPNHKATLREKLQRNFGENAVGPTTRGNVQVMRKFSRSMHLLQHPTKWIRDIGVIASILATWATPKAFKKHLYPPPSAVQRSDLLKVVRERPKRARTEEASSISEAS
jgi:2-polyprenyl-6-methoxyphenol hydroxylase-like FAD-dependent oxidoreductase